MLLTGVFVGLFVGLLTTCALLCARALARKAWQLRSAQRRLHEETHLDWRRFEADFREYARRSRAR